MRQLKKRLIRKAFLFEWRQQYLGQKTCVLCRGGKKASNLWFASDLFADNSFVIRPNC